MADGATPRPWGVCELPWDDQGTAIYAPPGDPHGARLIANTDTTWVATDDDEDVGVDQANADFIVRAVNAYDKHLDALRKSEDALGHALMHASLHTECKCKTQVVTQIVSAREATIPLLNAT